MDAIEMALKKLSTLAHDYVNLPSPARIRANRAEDRQLDQENQIEEQEQAWWRHQLEEEEERETIFVQKRSAGPPTSHITHSLLELP